MLEGGRSRTRSEKKRQDALRRPTSYQMIYKPQHHALIRNLYLHKSVASMMKSLKVSEIGIPLQGNCCMALNATLWGMTISVMLNPSMTPR